MADRLTTAQILAMTGLSLSRLEIMHGLGGPLRCGSDGLYLRRDVEHFVERGRR